MNRRRLWITLVLTLVLAWGSLAASLAAGWTPKLGLDLQGGFSVVLTAPEGTDAQVLDKAVEIMRDRIATLGSVQEPEISVQGARSILVQLPGVSNRERALQAVGTTGELSFRPVLAAGIVSPAFSDGTLQLPVDLTTHDRCRRGNHDDGSRRDDDHHDDHHDGSARTSAAEHRR